MAKEALDPVGSGELTRFAQLAGRVLDVPLVHISLVDAHHRYAESSQGLGWSHHRYITCLRMPLLTWDGRHVGMLSLKDRSPRRWSAQEIDFVKELCVRIVGRVDIGSPDQVM